MSSFLFVLFRFRLFAFTGAAALCSTVLRSLICARPDSHTQLPNNCLGLLFIFVSSFFLFLWRCRFFPSIFVPLPPFCLCMVESTYLLFPFRMVFFYLVTTGWIFYISLLCKNSINQSKQGLRIGQLKLCRMRLPYRQRQKGRTSRGRRDPKLAMRTAVTSLRQRSSRRR